MIKLDAFSNDDPVRLNTLTVIVAVQPEKANSALSMPAYLSLYLESGHVLTVADTPHNRNELDFFLE